METKTIQISPPYLQFFISDPESRDCPVQQGKIRVISSGDCISVPCQYAEEGPTELTVGEIDKVPRTGVLAFDGSIPTPNGILWFADAELTELLRLPVPTIETRLRIYTDGLEFPERVVVGIG